MKFVPFPSFSFPSPDIIRLIDMALEEDLGTGDHTTLSTVGPNQQGEARLRAREELVLSGIQVAAEVFRRADPSLEISSAYTDGARVAREETLLRVKGRLRSILTAERTALNFLGRLCGIATETRRFVDAVGDLPVKLIDTRKTTPLHRTLEKRAVRDGGGFNHRFNLSDGILIKDNHIVAAGSIQEALRRARKNQAHHLLRIELEIDTLEQLDEALDAQVDALLLDNFSLDMLREAVKRIDGRALTEASGGVTLETIRPIAETGVDMISIGGLVHRARWMDVGLDLAPIKDTASKPWI